MSTTPLTLDEQPDDLAALATLYLNDEADEVTVARLDALLQADETARVRFALLARMHGHLIELGRNAAAGKVDTARLLAPGPADFRTGSARRSAPQRRWAGWAAAAAILIVAGLFAAVLAAVELRAHGIVPIVTSVAGDVRLIRQGAPLAFTPGQRLRPGDHLELAAQASLVITLRGGTCALLPGTEATIEEVEGLRRRISLKRGELIADLRSSEDPLSIGTAAGSIAVADAEARISIVTSGTVVLVNRGSVGIQAPGTPDRILPAGQRLDLPAATIGSAEPAAGDTPPTVPDFSICSSPRIAHTRKPEHRSDFIAPTPGSPTTHDQSLSDPRIHPDRTAGGDHHHRRADRTFPASNGVGA